MRQISNETAATLLAMLNNEMVPPTIDDLFDVIKTDPYFTLASVDTIWTYLNQFLKVIAETKRSY